MLNLKIFSSLIVLVARILIKLSANGDNMNEAIEIMEEIVGDRAVPRNIREKISNAIKKAKENNPTTLSEAIYIMDDISNDVNMPDHTRTDIWHVISLVEAMKEKMIQ